jgi:hypothetical protein
VKKILRYGPLLLVCLIAIRCYQTYLPPPIATPAASLVVEGFIDNGGDTTLFNLSRTFALGATQAFTPELKAKVFVEGNDNSSYPLAEFGNGLYGAVLSGLNPTTSYRVDITTSAGKQYASDYVPLVTDPPIDSINWVRNGNGVTIYANTHDPSGNARYFRYNYSETYQFNSPFYTMYNRGDGEWVMMTEDTLLTCWHTDVSTSIILASSIQLSQAVIYEAPMRFIGLNGVELSIEYSIRVKQFALSKAAYQWWQVMQNNTENIGSIFGIQPSEDPGNLHCLSDTSEQVIGYISAGNSWPVRIFISTQQVAPWNYFDNACTRYFASDSVPFASGNWPLYPATDPILGMGYEASAATCADCLTNGYNHPPSFWP